MDVSNNLLVAKALKEVFEKEGRIDAVINTAGVLDKEPLVNMSYNEIYKSINVNYIGAVIVAKKSYSYLRKAKGYYYYLLLVLIQEDVLCIVCILRLKQLL